MKLYNPTGKKLIYLLLVEVVTSRQVQLYACTLPDESQKMVCNPNYYSLAPPAAGTGRFFFYPEQHSLRYPLTSVKVLPDIVFLSSNSMTTFTYIDEKLGYIKVEDFPIVGLTSVLNIVYVAEQEFFLFGEAQSPPTETDKYAVVRARLRQHSTDLLVPLIQDPQCLMFPVALADGTVQLLLMSRDTAHGYRFGKNLLEVETGVPGLAENFQVQVECSSAAETVSKTLRVELLRNTADRHKLRLPYTVSGPCGSKVVQVPVDSKSTNANSPEVKFFNTTFPDLVSPSDVQHSNPVQSVHIYDPKSKKNITFSNLKTPFEISANRMIVFNEEDAQYLVLTASLWGAGVQLSLEGTFRVPVGFELLCAKEYSLKQEEATVQRVLLLWTNNTHVMLEARYWRNNKDNYTVSISMEAVTSANLQTVDDGVLVIVSSSNTNTDSSGSLHLLKLTDETIFTSATKDFVWTKIFGNTSPEKFCPYQLESDVDWRQGSLRIVVASRCNTAKRDQMFVYYARVDVATFEARLMKNPTLYTVDVGSNNPTIHLGKNWLWVSLSSMSRLIGMQFPDGSTEHVYPLTKYYNVTQVIHTKYSRHTGLMQVLAHSKDEHGEAVVRTHVFKPSQMPQDRVHSVFASEAQTVLGLISVSGGASDLHVSIMFGSTLTARLLYLDGPHFGVNFEKLPAEQAGFRFNWTISMPGTPQRVETAPHWVKCYNLNKTVNLTRMSSTKLCSNGSIFGLENRIMLSGHYRKSSASSSDVLFTERSIKIKDMEIGVGVTKVTADYSYLMLVRESSLEILDLDEYTSIGITPVQGDVLDTGFYRDMKPERTKIYFAGFKSRGRTILHVGTCTPQGVVNTLQLPSPFPRCEASMKLDFAQPFMTAPDAYRLELMAASHCGGPDNTIRVYIQALKTSQPSRVLTINPPSKVISMQMLSLNTTEGDCLLIYQTDKTTLSTFVWLRATDIGPTRISTSMATSIIPNEVLNYDSMQSAGFRCRLIVPATGDFPQKRSRVIRCVFAAATPYSYVATHQVNLDMQESVDLITESSVESYLLPVLNFRPLQICLWDGFISILYKSIDGSKPTRVAVYSLATTPIPGTPPSRPAYRLYYPEDLGADSSEVKLTNLYTTIGTDKYLAVRLAAVSQGNLRLQYLNFLTCGVKATTTNFSDLKLTFENEDGTATDVALSSLFSVPSPPPAPTPVTKAGGHVLPLMLCVGLLFFAVLGVFFCKLLRHPPKLAEGDDNLAETQKELSIGG